MSAIRGRNGFALLIALAAILIASALMLAAQYSVQSDITLSRAGTLRRLAAVASETAAWNAVENITAAIVRGDSIGSVRKSIVVNGSDTTTVVLIKTDTTFAWLVADASILRGSQRARHRVGVTLVIPRDTMRMTLVPIAGRAWVEAF
ncbi:MAG: hypothetical protein ACR2M1_08710 [Gemmatimonadaceae bacterium]